MLTLTKKISRVQQPMTHFIVESLKDGSSDTMSLSSVRQFMGNEAADTARAVCQVQQRQFPDDPSKWACIFQDFRYTLTACRAINKTRKPPQPVAHFLMESLKDGTSKTLSYGGVRDTAGREAADTARAVCQVRQKQFPDDPSKWTHTFRNYRFTLLS